MTRLTGIRDPTRSTMPAPSQRAGKTRKRSPMRWLADPGSDSAWARQRYWSPHWRRGRNRGRGAGQGRAHPRPRAHAHHRGTQPARRRRSLHKLEAHQIARTVASNARLVASLYKQDPPLLRTNGDERVITDAGRAWLAEHPPA
jgi:hypothetical protein